MQFHPDVLAGQLPATKDQVLQLAKRAFEANREAGKGYAILEMWLDDYQDWALRRDSAYADGLFVALLAPLLQDTHGLLCGWREDGKAVLYIQNIQEAEVRELAVRWVQEAQGHSLSSRGGPHQLSLSMGGAHISGFRKGSGECDLHSLSVAASRGARLVSRTGGNRSAIIERFGLSVAADEPILPSIADSSLEDEQHPSGTQATKGHSHASQAEPRSPDSHNLGVIPPSEDVSAEELKTVLSEQYGETFEHWLQGRDAEWEKRVELLERRLEKLGSLVEAGIPGERNQRQVDTGLASRFQTVQGLAQDDDQFEAKQGLMAALLVANQEMRDRIQGRSAG